MKTIDWEKEVIETGIVEINIQHQVLYKMINILYDSILQKRSFEVLEVLFDEILSYSKDHFEYEENLLKTHKALTNEHKEDHKNFLIEIKKLKKHFKNSKDNSDKITQELIDYTLSWVRRHFKNLDLPSLKKVPK